MCRITKSHSSARCNFSCPKDQPYIEDASKKHKMSLIFHIKYRLHYILLCLRAFVLHYIENDKPKNNVNRNDAKQTNQSTNIVHRERVNVKAEIIATDATKRITVGDVPEVSYRLSTCIHEDGDVLSGRNESDQSLIVDVSSLTIAPSLSMENLQYLTDTTVNNFEEKYFIGATTDLDRNDGVNLEEVENTDISWEAFDSTTFNISLDVRDFEEDVFERVITLNSASNENVNSQEVRDIQRSSGCIQFSEETDDPIISNINYDETRLGVKEKYNFLTGFDNQDNYSGDECRGETKDECKILETKLDSGLGDSIKTTSSHCNSETVFRSIDSEEYCSSGIVLEDASIKGENETLFYDGKHMVSRLKERITTLLNTKHVHLWSHTNVTLRRNLNNESKWRLYPRRSFTSNNSSLGTEYDHSFEQFINGEGSAPLCEFLLKVRCAGDNDINTFNCNKCNRDLSASRAKIFNITLIEGSEKAVPITLFSWLDGSAIRFICPEEYIVLPASLKTYFNRVTVDTLTREEIMTYEWIRYSSFCSFPTSTDISATRLANAGFYSTGTGIQARCFCCNVTYDHWSRGDDPHEVHRRISPNCPFIRGEAHDPQNVPIYQQVEQNTSGINENFSHPLQAQHTLSMSRTNPSSAQTSSASSRSSAVDLGQESFIRSLPIPQLSTKTETKESSDRNQLAIPPNTADRQYSVNSESKQNGAAIHGHIDDNRITQNARPDGQGLPASTLEDAPLSIAQQPTEDAYNTDYSNPGNFSFRPTRDSREDNDPGEQYPSPSREPLRTREYPKHSDYQMLEKRIKSFTGWPLYLDQTPQQMAEAGFFHVGVQDYVRCFQCGGGLRNFEAGDNPWIEHARWYPQCAYVRVKKGQRFVEAVTKKQQELLAQQASQNVIDTSPSKSASLGQSVCSGSGASRDSASPKVGDPGKQASLNENASQIKAAVTGHSNQSRPVYRNVDARLSGPASLAYTVPGNTLGHLNGRTRESSSRREAFNIPEASSMPPFDPQSIIKEHARLRNSSLCKVCQQRQAVIAFLPCGHLATCESCAPTQTVCCVCQKKILASIRTYK